MQICQKVCDLLVIGSGGAGSAAASAAAKAGKRVLLLSKDPLNCSDSKISEGIITVQGNDTAADSQPTLAANMRIQGDDIGDPELLSSFAGASSASYQWLREQGLKPEFSVQGQPKSLGMPMGGHSHSRSVPHPNGGLDYAHALWQAVTQVGQVEIVEDCWFLDLYVEQDADQKRILGGCAYHAATGQLLDIRSKGVVLACGGIGSLYFPHTDTMRGNTGDAYGIAARAGARLVDMEQIQFIPFAAVNPPSHRGLVLGEPISAGALGVIRDGQGDIILTEVMARTRAQCCAAISKAVAAGKGTENDACYLDLRGNVAGASGIYFRQLMAQKAPGLMKLVKSALGSKAAKFEQMWEVKPSAHYCMGGVATNGNGQVLDAEGKVMPGLYAAGQALGGLHGSNRLGSTSLAEAAIFGRLCGAHAAANPVTANGRASNNIRTMLQDWQSKPGQQGNGFAIERVRELQQACWEGIGPARNEAGLAHLAAELDKFKSKLTQCTISGRSLFNQSFLDWIEAQNLLQCALLITHSALERKASLGAHFRSDHPVAAGQNFATASRIDPSGKILVNRLARQPSPFLSRIKLGLIQQGKLAQLKLVRRLPVSLRERVLSRKYRRILEA